MLQTWAGYLLMAFGVITLLAMAIMEVAIQLHLDPKFMASIGIEPPVEVVKLPPKERWIMTGMWVGILVVFGASMVATAPTEGATPNTKEVVATRADNDGAESSEASDRNSGHVVEGAGEARGVIVSVIDRWRGSCGG